MLAQLNSKKNSIFLNLKPTVIDKLISKNKSSIQNSYTNEESDGSLSEDSDDSWSSCREVVEQSLEMAPVKRSDKGVVLGSKLSRAQSPMKTFRERSSKNLVVRGEKPLEVIAAKKVIKNRKKDSLKKLDKDESPSVSAKRKVSESRDNVKAKRSRCSVKKANPPIALENDATSELLEPKPTVTKRKPKILKEVKPNKASENKNPTRSSTQNEINDNPSSTKSSPRKFPINTVDQWKSTGMVIRGRGRVGGQVVSRRGMRGRPNLARISSRSARYVTRESQVTGLMRSGKRRKVSDTLVEGLHQMAGKGKKRALNRVKEDKNDFPSDEHSSFVTTSEHSFCDNDSLLKQTDYENMKIEPEETEDEMIHPRDTNCNVFRDDRIRPKTSSCSSDTNGASNHSTKQRVFTLGQRRWFSRGRKRSLMSGRKSVNISQSDSSVKDSDCSIDSEVAGNIMTTPIPEMKRKKRKVVDGWVRRSTRSVGKDDKPDSEPAEIEKVFVGNNIIEDLDSNSKSSFNIDLYVNDSLLINSVDGSNSCSNMSPKINDGVTTVIKETIHDQKTVLVNSFLAASNESISTDECSLTNVSIMKKEIIVNSTEQNKDIECDSLETFSLVFEETPDKKESAEFNPEVKSKVSKLNLDSLGVEHTSTVADDKPDETETIEILAVDQSAEKSCEELTEKSNCENIITCTNLGSLESHSLGNDAGKTVVDHSLTSFVDIEKPCIKTNITVDSADSFIGTIDKSHDLEISERAIISDENILSMIDSFCQSDSSFDEDKQMSGVPIDDGSKITVDSASEITEEAENNILESSREDLSSSTEITKAAAKTNLVNNEQKLELMQKSPSEPGEANKESNIELLPTIQKKEGDKTNENFTLSKVASPERKHDDTGETENIEVKSEINFLESDNDVHKIVESSEESSSSDSNSNLFEALSTPLDNDSESVNKDSSRNMGRENLNILVSKDKEFQDIQSQSEQSSRDSSTQSKPDKNDETSCPGIELASKQIENREKDRGPSEELLSALGLQSLQNVMEEKPKRPTDNYTGTLKAVIKLNRSGSDKRSGGRKMIFKQGDSLGPDSLGGGDRLEYRICNTEVFSTEGVPLTHLADIPANRKTQMKVKSQFDLSSSPNIIGTAGSSTEVSSDSNKEPGSKQALVIPEKSSSFSIHPERLCTDVCAYCFGKFGSLDTPCHLAQLKNAERQAKILAIEVHLLVDSCLCDGCFRYVDRKANCPSAQQRSRKPGQPRRGSLTGAVCVVQNCEQPARHSVRRKWLIKLKKSIGKKLVIDMDKNAAHLPFPLCSAHYYWVDYFTVCGICKKRLTRNHMYALGPEAEELNQALSDDGIPVRLSDKLFLCKLCRYYGSLRLKYRDPATMSSTHRLFLNSYRRKILHYHDMPVSDSDEEEKAAEEESGNNALEVAKSKKKKAKNKSLNGIEPKKKSTDKEGKPEIGSEEQSNDSQMIDYSYLDKLHVHREESSTMDYSSLSDFNGQVGFSNIASLLNPLEGGKGTVYPQTDPQNRSRTEKPTRIQVKFGNLNIGKLSNLNIGQDTRPPSSETATTERPPYLPGERELNLSGEFEFHGTARSNWERCTSTIQFDQASKKLWQELQRPYGNQSSFLRHLVILEKHWRGGSLVFTDNANPRAVKYLNSVQNRVQAYDAKPSAGAAERPKVPEGSVLTPLPPTRPPSAPVRTTSAPPPLMKLTPRLTEQLRRPPPPYVTATQTSATAARAVGAPPPYRLPPAPRASLLLPRLSSVRMHASTPPSARPTFSMSYQQFKKIRLEPPSTSSRVTVVPKQEPATDARFASLSHPAGEFVPLICDVRSLAPRTEDWSESFRKQQQQLLKQNVAKYYFTPKGPKIPDALTVTQYPTSAELVMKTSSLTIEKAPSTSTKTAPAPPEKPSISVFRETTSGDNG